MSYLLVYVQVKDILVRVLVLLTCHEYNVSSILRVKKKFALLKATFRINTE